MRIGKGMSSSWITTVTQWLILILLLPSLNFDSSCFTEFMNTQSSITTPSSSSSSSTMMMVVVVDAANVANPTDQYNIDESYLRVTIRHQTFHEIPSCQHRITQIELHNLHSKKDLIINSIDTTDEITKLIGDEDHDVDTYDKNNERSKGRSPGLVMNHLPQQLYMSKLPADGKLRLGPGQVAIVPVAFLPRYPVLFEDFETIAVVGEKNRTTGRTQHGRNSKVTSHNDDKLILSPYQRADWEECMDSMNSMVGVEGNVHSMEYKTDPHQDHSYTTSQQKHRRPNRNNLHLSEAPNLQPKYVNARFRLTTSISINSSRGKFLCPFEIVSRRSNLFGLPDLMVFDIPDDMNIDSDDYESSRNSIATGMSHNSINMRWKDDKNTGLNDNDRKIQETLDLFRAVKDKEKLALLSMEDLNAPASNNIVDRNRKQNQNPYSLGNDAKQPFEFHGQFENRDTVNSKRKRVRIVDRRLQQADVDPNLSEHTKAATTSFDCYDLYLRNPDPNTPLIVSEILLSKSKLVNLYVIPDKHNETFTYSHPSHRHIKDWSNRSKSIFGKSAGSLTIPGDGESHYVVTVCAAIVQQAVSTAAFSHADQSNPNSSFQGKTSFTSPTIGAYNGDTFLAGFPDWIDIGFKGITLGFLQIKTSQGALFVGIVKANEIMRRQLLSSYWKSDSDPRLEHKPASDASIESDQLNLTNVENVINTADTYNAKPPERFLTTAPGTIDFSFVTTSLSSFEVPINIINVSPSPLTIMRLAVVLDDKVSGSDVNATIRSRGIDLKIINVVDALSKPIAAGSGVTNATTLLCSVDWTKLLKNSASRRTLEMKGALILRGTSETTPSYANWLGTLKAGSVNQSNFVVEIPITIKVVHGTVGFLVEGTSLLVPSLWSMRWYSEMLDIVSAAFFPYHPSLTSAIISEEEKGKNRAGYFKGADHQFRIFNDMGIDVALSGLSVVENSTVYPTDSSLCERFDTYIVERGPSDHIDLEDLRNMGLVHVRYRYPDQETPRATKLSSKVSMFDHSYPVICSLRVTTEPPSGTHTIDLVVYYGQLAITKDPYSSDPLDHHTTATADDNRSWYHVIAGLENVMEWFRTTKAGFSLRSVLQASTDRNNDVEQDTILLSRYLYRLAQKRPNPDTTSLKPVLLNVGGLEQDESTTAPLYVTNYNPVPITITVAVGGLEGQSISLGRLHIAEKGAKDNFFDRLLSRQRFVGRGKMTDLSEPRAFTGRFRGHPINGLRSGLMASKITHHYFQQFQFRDDISMSHFAVSKFPYLKKMYEQSAIYILRAKLSPPRPTRSSLSQCDDSVNPPTYGEFQKKDIQAKEASTGPIIISGDRKSFRRLKVCRDANGESGHSNFSGTKIVIPAGGVARFDVNIRAPSQNNLPKDITHFVATGLVLTTDHGEVIPILVSFKALRGSLELSPVSASQGEHREINVPIDLFGIAHNSNSKHIKIPPQNDHALGELNIDNMIVTRNVRADNAGLSLFAKSTFSRDIHLRRIDSCNPCFSADLDTTNATAEADPFLGVHIGTVRSVVTCSPIVGLPLQNASFPSFFRCALDWLTRRGDLQPRGCGHILTETPLMHADKVSVEMSYDSIIQSVRRALLLSEWSDQYFGRQSISMRLNSTIAMKSGRRSLDGAISFSVINAVTDALESLDIAAKAGYLTLGTSLRAVVEYNATPDEISPVKRGSTTFHEPNQTLSLAIDKTLLTSHLRTPQLLNHEKSVGIIHPDAGTQRVTFHPTAFGEMSSMKIPIRNPTGIPVRVRLGVERRRSRPHFDPPYTQKVFRSDVSPLVWANEQWWDHGGAFFQGDFNGNVIRSPYNVSVKSGLGAFISTMNPSVSSNIAFLNGCGSRCGIVENDYGLPLPVAVAEVSPIGAAATAGVFITGNGKYVKEFNGNKQTWYKRFTGSAGASFVTGGQGPTAFALPYSAMDEIIVPPYGEAELGPILFRPTGRTWKLGCDAMTAKKSVDACKSQMFMSTIFIENSLTGIEEVTVEGKALWEKIVFVSPDPNSDFDDIELRHGFPTLTFPSQGKSSTSMRQQPTIKQVVICNEGDISVTIHNGFLSAQKWNGVDVEREALCEFKGFRIIGCDENEGLESFQLLPGQNRSIYIEFKPNTSRKRDYIMLHFDLGHRGDHNVGLSDGMIHTFESIGRLSRRKDTFRRKLSLSIGHEISKKIIERDRFISTAVNEIDYGSKRLFETIRYQESPRTTKSQRHRILKRGFNCVVFFCFAIVWFMVVGPKLRWFRNYSITYYSNLVGLVTPPVEGQTWRAMLRCLATINPSSCDLQSIGRDQTRHMVLARLKLMGAMQPQCLNSAGVPKRERAGASGSAGRHVSSNSGYKNNKSTVSERVRMSDAIFAKLDPTLKSCGRKGLFPVQLGWRCAAARGIIDPTTLKTSPIKLTTEDLHRRRTQPIPSRIQAIPGGSSFDGDNSSSASGLDSSLGDLSVDENVPNDVPEIVTYDREMISPVPSSIEQIGVIKEEGNSKSPKSFNGKNKRDEQLMQGENASDHLTKLEDYDPLVEVDEPDIEVKLLTEVSTTLATKDVSARPNDESNDYKNQASSDDRIENIQAEDKNPVENLASKRSSNTSSKIVAKPKPSTKKEKAQMKPSNTGKINMASKERSSNATTLDDTKSSVLEVKDKNQSAVARSKGKPEKTSGRGKIAPPSNASSSLPATSSNVSSSLRATKADITVTKRSSEGSDPLDISNTASLSPSARPPTRLLPPPGFTRDLTSPDRSQNDSRASPIDESARSTWNSKHNVAAESSDNATVYPLSLNSSTDRELTHPFLESPSHASCLPQYSPLQQNLLPMVDDSLLGYNNNSNANISFIKTDTPSAATILGPTTHNIIPFGVEGLDATGTTIAASPLHQSMVPGLSSLVPSFSLDNEDSSNRNNSFGQYGTHSMTMDFDVMDFLDQILEEGNTENGIDQFDNTTADGKTSNSGMILNNIVPMASINPWSMDTSENSGTSYHQNLSSRAAAYGIAFERTNSRHPFMSFQEADSNNNRNNNDIESPTMMRSEVMTNRDNVVPLLTPSTIMTSVYYNDDEANSNNPNYNANGAYRSSNQQSFYGDGNYRS